MKIGIEAQRLFREKKHGLEIVALELIRILQKIDQENEYVIFVRKDTDREIIHETSNFKIIEIDSSSYPLWEQWALPNAVKQERIDLLHCTANTVPLRLSVPTVVTLHDIIFMEKLNWSKNYYQSFGNLYRRAILPRVINKVKKVITVSHSEKELITDRFQLPETSVEVVYNAVNSSFRKKEDAETSQVRSRFNLPESFILFFGNIAQKKNSLETLKAYVLYATSSTDAIPLVIAGAFETEIRTMVESLNLPATIGSKIMIIGHIPFHDQPAIYNLATLFLYTSTRESFGMPILESMACGTPVITSSTSCMPEIAGGAACLANPYEAQDMAKAITKILGDPTYCQLLIESGYERAHQFTWEASARQLLTIYQKATAN